MKRPKHFFAANDPSPATFSVSDGYADYDDNPWYPADSGRSRDPLWLSRRDLGPASLGPLTCDLASDGCFMKMRQRVMMTWRQAATNLLLSRTVWFSQSPK